MGGISIESVAEPTEYQTPPQWPIQPEGSRLTAWWRKYGGLVTAAATVFFIICGFISLTRANQPVPTVTVTQTATVTATATSTQTVTASPQASAGEQVDPRPTVETVPMPDYTGMNLQEAQDRLQVLGVYILDQEDASGRGRVQVIDSHWYVCRQDPVPGAMISSATKVTLWSVKNNESCG
jgi:hypothetical protein